MRLYEIAKLINPYKKIADVGTDHGLLIKHAFILGINYAQAIDNKIGPLNKAKENLFEYSDNIDFTLAEGISQLNPKVECIILSGLGGINISNILSEDKEKLTNIKRIITSPHKNSPKVRKTLAKLGFKVVLEKIIFDDEHYYELIVFEKGEISYKQYEIDFGPLFLQNKDPLWMKMWEQEYNKLTHPKTITKKNYIKKYVFSKETNYE